MGVCVSFDTDYGISSSQIRQSCCKIILIASAGPNKAWFTELLELSVHDPIKLPLIPKLLMQPGRPLFHNCPELLNLHAWMLQGNPSLNSGFSAATAERISAPQRKSTKKRCDHK